MALLFSVPIQQEWQPIGFGAVQVFSNPNPVKMLTIAFKQPEDGVETK